MEGVLQVLRGLGPSRLAILGGVTLGLIGFFIFLTMRITTPAMSLLYSDLSQDDSTQIISQLEAKGIPYELADGGNTLMVPSNQVSRIRMAMAEEGLPMGGSVGYEIFDEQSTLGTTSFVQNINRVRALEGELERTIRSIERIQSARVHLVIPKRELFAKEQKQPTASIALKLKGGKLPPAQVAAVQHLVAAAVEGLDPELVAIVDERGNMLASGQGQGDAQASSLLQERNQAFEDRIRRRVEDILESIVGPNKSRVQVSAEVDYNKVTENSEIYDPDGQVVRSTQTTEEQNEENERAGASGTVTVGNNLPDADLNNANADTSVSRNNRVAETVNYEISKTTKVEVHEAGRIRRLSVAVLVDGLYSFDPDGNRLYQERPEEELDKIRTLVESAVGFDQSRGDRVAIQNIKFADLREEQFQEEIPDDTFLGLTKADMMKIAETLVLGIVAVLVVLLVVRPLLARIGASDGVPEQLGGGALTSLAMPGLEPGAMLGADPSQIAAHGGLTDLHGQPLTATSGSALPPPPPMQSETEQMIDMAHIEGQVKMSSIRKVGEIVDKHPEEALSIIRAWLYESS